MRLSEADPVDVLKNAWALRGMGVRAIHFCRPVLLHVTGEHDPDRGFKAQLFVQGATPALLYHLGDAPEAVRKDGATSATILAGMFPGVSITEPSTFPQPAGHHSLVRVGRETTPAPAAVPSFAEAVKRAEAAGQVTTVPWTGDGPPPGERLWDGSHRADVSDYTGDGADRDPASVPNPAAPPVPPGTTITPAGPAAPIVIELTAPPRGQDGLPGGAAPDTTRDESFDDF